MKTPELTFQTYRTFLHGRLVAHTKWEARLGEVARRGLVCHYPTLDVATSTMMITRESDEGYEYELEVEVCGDYEPAQNGGRSDPSWDAYWTGICAYYHREGKGWVELSLSDSEEKQIEEFLGQDQYGGPDDYDAPYEDCRY